MSGPNKNRKLKIKTTISDVVGISFGVLTDDDIRKLSVKRIDSASSFDKDMKPIPGGLYDPALGVSKATETCPTCGLSGDYCPGHVGHIELPVPLYNPMLFPRLLQLLKLMCFSCHNFRIHKSKLDKLVEVIKLVSAKKFEEALKAEEELYRWENPTTNEGDEKTKEDTAEKDVSDDLDPRRPHLTRSSYETIRKMMTVLFKQTPPDKCANCKAFTISVKKDPHSVKLFLVRPSRTRLQQMWKLGIRYPYPLPINGQQPPLPDDLDPITKWLWDLDSQMASDKNTESNKDDNDTEDGDSVSMTKKRSTEDATDIDFRKHKEMKDLDPTSQHYMHPIEVEKHMQMLWENCQEAMDYLFGSLTMRNGECVRVSTYKQFFQRVVAVSPNRFRPPSVVGEIVTENPRNSHLSALINLAQRFHLIYYGKEPPNKKGLPSVDSSKPLSIRLDELGVQMQYALNRLYDNRPNNKSSNGAPGVKQTLEKKHGLFRQNMMGKRVNYAGRTVISPDPNIETNEIGVPLYFATRLTYPEPVNAWNVERLRQMVINGPKIHPGAVAVEDPDGNIIRLSAKNERQRLGVAKTLSTPTINSIYGKTPHGVKRVFRHLVDGDLLIVNRQPTLHKPSMMVHKAKVLGKEKTFFLHYANCNTYNADFDGDEMNIHFPQNEIARAEMKTIAITDEQYVVPKDGSPLRGLIQDHIVGGVKLTKRDTFLTRGEVQWLLYVACFNVNSDRPFKIPPPAILKPKPLWTGKQVITAILQHLCGTKFHPINLRSKEQIPDEMWGPGSEEANVVIVENELVCGVLGKKQFGNKAHGLVHAIYELWNPEMAGKTLTALGKLFTAFIQLFSGFTCGMDDLLLTDKLEKQRKKFIRDAEASGIVQAGIFTGVLPAEATKAEKSQQPEIIDKLKELLQSAEECEKWDKHMISFAGGLTSSLIDMCLPVGQLKPFPDNNLAMMTISGAKGSRVNQAQITCLLGQQELEGRRPPLMPSGRALPCFEPFDPNPRAGAWVADRFLSGLRPPEYFFHTMAGREGLIDTAVKTSRSGYLQRCIIKHLETMCVHYDYTVRDLSDGSVIQFRYGEDGLDVTRTGWLSELDFLAQNCQAIISTYDTAAVADKLQVVPRKLVKKIRKKIKNNEHPDTILSTFSPGTHIGCVSEKFEDAIDKFVERNPNGVLQADAPPGSNKVNPSYFRSAMYLKYAHALAQPGELVGILAGQSIGEPSTQMTLNTFHLAGKGDVNVTLGIPRLRELIMTAGNTIKTPSMILPLRSEITKEKAQQLTHRMARVTLGDVHEETVVRESLKPKNGLYHRVYDVEVKFRDPDPKFGLSKKQMFERLEDRFMGELLARIHRDLKMKRPTLGGDPAATFHFADRLATSFGGDGEEEEEAEDTVSLTRRKSKNDEEAPKKGRAKDYDEEDDEGSDNEADDNQGQNENIDEEEKEEAEDEGAPRKPKTYASEILETYHFDRKKMMLTFTLVVNADKPKLLLVEIIDKMCNTFIIRAIPGIRRATLLNPDKNNPELRIQTEGINILHVWRLYNLIDLSKLHTNDVNKLCEYYGIEAARAGLIKEISSVFKAYGITVDFRHLSLIADYMTRDGVITPMSRNGFGNNTSPFLKMSFETSVKFLQEAAFTGEFDRVHSPSAQICVGRAVSIGSGMVDVLLDTSFKAPNMGGRFLQSTPST